MRVFAIDKSNESGTRFVKCVTKAKTRESSVDVIWRRDDELAGKAVLDGLESLHTDESVLVLAHVDDSDWSDIVHGLKVSQNAVRFSGGTLEASPPLFGDRLGCGFVCCKSSYILEESDIQALISAFERPSLVVALRSGQLPTELLGLLSFAPIAKLHELNILLQAWAANQGECSADSFRSALLRHDTTGWGGFWHAMRRELGLDEGRELKTLKGRQPSLGELLELLQQSEGSVPDELVKRASVELRALLARTVG
jgi:hypothetical protein